LTKQGFTEKASDSNQKFEKSNISKFLKILPLPTGLLSNIICKDEPFLPGDKERAVGDRPYGKNQGFQRAFREIFE